METERSSTRARVIRVLRSATQFRRLRLAAVFVGCAAWAALPAAAGAAEAVSRTPSAEPSPIQRALDEIAALPDSGELASPVLWAGELGDDASGPPKAATVVAEVRPGHLVKADDSTPLIPVAKQLVGADGKVTLRVDNSETMNRYADPSGWVTLLLFANSGTAQGAWVQSVKFVDGVWISNDHGIGEPESTDPRSAAAATQQADSRHRMVLSNHSNLARAFTGPTEPPAGVPCVYDNVYQPLGALYTGASVELNLVSGNWKLAWSYDNTASTSWGVGVGFSSFGAFSANGSITYTDSSGAGAGSDVYAGGRNEVRLQDAWYRFRFTCYIDGLNPPETKVYTVEDQEWVGGSQVTNHNDPPSCDSTYKSQVPALGYFTRHAGASTTIKFNLGVSGGFDPTVLTNFWVSNSGTAEHDTKSSYYNLGNAAQVLCGHSDWITKDTRVVSLKS